MAVTVEREGPVLVATMDDGKANALTFDGVGELRSIVTEAAESAKPLVLAGRDGIYCAGFDLSVMKSGDPERVRAILAEGRALYRAIVEAPVPVIAACTGHALAGGALLLMSADHRIGRPGPYKIGLNEVQIGMGLPQFAITLARYRLDPRHLTAAACFAELGTADRAVEVGFLDQVAEDPLSAAVELATQLASYSHEAFALTKSRVRAPLVAELDAIPTTEAEVFPTVV
jgi:enoyl-CoA hydratase